MKIIIHLSILSLSLAVCAPVFADTATAQSDTAIVAKAAANNPKIDVKDEALRFILDKAKLYSGKMENALGTAVDVAQKETPETIKQFLIWRSWKHGLYAASSMALLMLTAGLIIWSWKTWEGASSEGEFLRIMGSVVTTVVSLMIFGGSGLPNLLSFIQIQVAPRIYLIEQLSQLIK